MKISRLDYLILTVADILITQVRVGVNAAKDVAVHRVLIRSVETHCPEPVLN